MIGGADMAGTATGLKLTLRLYSESTHGLESSLYPDQDQGGNLSCESSTQQLFSCSKIPPFTRASWSLKEKLALWVTLLYPTLR